MRKTKETYVQGGAAPVWKPTPQQAASLLLHLIGGYEAETGRRVTRARLSQTTVRKACGRSFLRTKFLLSLQDQLIDLGWILFVSDDNNFGIISGAAVNTWRRVGGHRLDGPIAELRKGGFDYASLVVPRPGQLESDPQED